MRSKLDAKSRVEFDRLLSDPLKGEDGTNLINKLSKKGEEYSNMQHAVDSWMKMTTEQQEEA